MVWAHALCPADPCIIEKKKCSNNKSKLAENRNFYLKITYQAVSNLITYLNNWKNILHLKNSYMDKFVY